LFADPQVEHLGLRPTVQHPRAGEVPQTGLPSRLSRTPGGVRRPPPLLGEHTDEVLAGVGYSAEEIAALRARGAVLPRPPGPPPRGEVSLLPRLRPSE